MNPPKNTRDRAIQVKPSNRRNPSSARHPLPAAFVGAGFLNFAIGASLGAAMSVHPAWVPALLPIHAALNPFGWLTLMIYGMTFATLTRTLGVKLSRPVLLWSQLAIAEGGVIAVSLSSIFGSPAWLAAGIALLAAAPVVFLVNILGSVRTSRVQARANPVAVPSRPTSANGQTARPDGDPDPEALAPKVHEATEKTAASKIAARIFGHTPLALPTDRIARRGTDISALFLLIGVFSAGLRWLAVGGAPDSWLDGPPAILVYYGWIGGTALSVALHIYPRMAAAAVPRPGAARLGLGLWLSGTLIAGPGAWLWAPLSGIGQHLQGLAVALIGILLLYPVEGSFPGIPRESVLAWRIAWSFATVLGFSLLAGLSADSLAALHLLFLGFITTLVYSVGYTFFPVVIRRKPRFPQAAAWQVVLSAAGAALLCLGFYALNLGTEVWAGVSLGLGGSLAAAGALFFLVQWAAGRPEARGNP